MNRFATDIIIHAPIEKVWEALADIGTISEWNPGVVDSHITSQGKIGLGSTRYCDLGGKNFLDEEVVTWKPNEQLTMRITDTNMPFKHADIRFFLKKAGAQTHVTVSPEYQLKYGVIGNLLDKVFVARTYEKGMGDLLAGLKAHIESL
ncbi:MAG: SRPBCC family protein [Chloroflexota bacterium]